jgi:hypothetical protein
VLAERAAGQHQVAGGQRQRPAVGDGADAGEQLVAGRGERAAEGDPAGFHRCTSVATSSPTRPAASRTAATAAASAPGERRAQVRDRPHRFPGALQAPHDRARRGHGLDAADVAADARLVGGAPDAHVPDVARRAVRPVVQPARGVDEPTADPGADLDEEQRGLVGRQRPGLAERTQVHVVLTGGGAAEPLAEPRGDGVGVPAGHDRRADGGAEPRRPPAGQADDDRPDGVRAGPRRPGVSRSAASRSSTRVRTASGPSRTSTSRCSWASTRWLRSTTAMWAPARPDVGEQDVPAVGGQREPVGGPAAPGGGAGARPGAARRGRAARPPRC